MLLDSVIIIDHLNGVEAASRFIKKHHQQIYLSVITRAEVLSGCTPVARESVTELLDAFPVIILTAKEADFAALVRQQYRLKLPDALQAAMAMHHKKQLVTRNTKDFRKEWDFVLIPYVF